MRRTTGMRVKTRDALVAMIVAGGMLGAGLASALGPPDDVSELKCQTATGKGLGKFAGSYAKCVTKCWKDYRKGLVPDGDCYEPYGGATSTCLQDPAKGAFAKTVAKIGKGCAIDCPECYLSGQCNVF